MTATAPLPVVREPEDGIPPVITDAGQLSKMCSKLKASTGPLAIDAERAGSYRYSQGAYLLQVRSDSVGTYLIDPIALPDLAQLAAAGANKLWILHAAQNDLPCLDDLGLIPPRLFDTEIAAQLLGEEHFSLGALVAKYCGVELEKKYSMVDWSKRPLPRQWLSYAALDVEFLIPLYHHLETQLRKTGKHTWAKQECEALRRTTPPQPSAEPWRDMRGLGRITKPRSLALARELWRRRDELARHHDISPARMLSDKVIVQIARQLPSDSRQLSRIVHGRHRRWLREWDDVLTQVQTLRADDLPRRKRRRNEYPHQRLWKANHPDAQMRLQALRDVTAAVAEDQSVSKDVLLPPKIQRQIAWYAPVATKRAVTTALRDYGARDWQIDLMCAPVVTALKRAAHSSDSAD
ncbi:MAG: HRDC domain-containing protein [Bowdeniella nasicola]|nr:HRDC domain-containing protein [Bowdeniella nasicola]